MQKGGGGGGKSHKGKKEKYLRIWQNPAQAILHLPHF